MDIRRLPLWEGRNATIMSNGESYAVIEDQGEVLIELSNLIKTGARVNPLALPYFRGTGSGVLSDPNGTWYSMKETLYQAGGAYFTFPYPSEERITSNNTYWMVRRYGTEEAYGGVWRLSTMKSREEGNRYELTKLDYLSPDNPFLYTLVNIRNNGDDVLEGSPAFNAMLGSPFFETGVFMNTNGRHFTCYQRGVRELAENRLKPNLVFEDIRKAPLLSGGVTDASIVPIPTGSYDYILGKVPSKDKTGWITVTNPNMMSVLLAFTPVLDEESVFNLENVSITENYLGRIDAPWALFDGGTSQVSSLSVGFNSGPKGTRNMALIPGEEKKIMYALGFFNYDNPRISLGFYSGECHSDSFTFKRTKSAMHIKADTSFARIRKLYTDLIPRPEEGE